MTSKRTAWLAAAVLLAGGCGETPKAAPAPEQPAQVGPGPKLPKNAPPGASKME